MCFSLIGNAHKGASVPEPFKNLIGREQVDWLAQRLVGVERAFPADAFRQIATKGLEHLELKARARHIADALELTLPKEPAKAFLLLTQAMDPPLQVTEGFGPGVFRYLPISEFLERHGPSDVDAALKANYALTQRFTSEYCIRSLILSSPQKTMKQLTRWLDDPSPHVRRLVSEGTRPRLPWGKKLAPFIADPSPILPLLARLKDDESDYVRRSVANNLNDISKDHPELVLQLASEWMVKASRERQKLVEHGLRTLLKRGDARALKLLGARSADSLQVSGSITPSKLSLGQSICFKATVKNIGTESTHVVAEVRVHFVRAKGISIKAFRLGRLDLLPSQQLEISKSMTLQHRSIRRLFAGIHKVELQVNGTCSSMGQFTLSM